MKRTGLFPVLFALGLLLPASGLAQEAPAEPLLVAHLRALDQPELLPNPVRSLTETERAGKDDLGFLDASLRWSPEKAALNLASPTGKRLALTLDLDPQPFLSIRPQAGAPAWGATPLPRNLPWTSFTHSRARGPFEQVYPRIY